MIRLEPGLLVKNYGVKTGHGSPYEYDTHIPLIFYGKEIHKGESEIRIGVTEIAPTILRLLGVEDERIPVNKNLVDIFSR